MHKVNHELRLDMLNTIFEHFQQVTQSMASSPESEYKYYIKAEALIEFLEINDCGSFGGYDLLCPMQNVTGCSLFDRFLTLIRKYEDENHIRPIFKFTLSKLTLYFKTIHNLREAI